MTGDIRNLVETIKRIKHADGYKYYIDYIQFPFFRNLELDQRINFTFPLTVFVGPNGSGKSSTLHAIYGCPEGKTPYDFWFATDVDPVVYQLESRDLRHSFFYGYKNENGEELQVVKARIKRKDNPNYWETSRPLISYGMNPPPDGKERNEPIKKNVVYLDFRSELSAFDKYFYFEMPPENLVSKTKQDYLRYKSKYLKYLFDLVTTEIKSPHGYKQNEKLVNLNKEELVIISEILGKNYTSGKVLKHKLYHTWGFSILLKTKFHEYTEAFAGSGEMSIVRLVQNILNAPEGSLILLDEPEVSLHPGAQKRLKCFLLDQIKKNKHQIVISTHSPAIIGGLPKEAIKVFFQKEDTGKFIVKENILAEEAFYFIGHEVGDKINVIVEDKLSKKIIERILIKLGEEVNNRFIVKFMPGGASVLQQQITIYSNANVGKSFFIFDGDQKRSEELFDVNTLSDANKTIDYLKNIIKDQTGVDIKFYPDGGVEGGNQDQLTQMMISFLKYYKEHIFYLPQAIPEDLIWAEEEVKQKLNLIVFEGNIDRIRNLDNNKDRIYEVSKILFGVDNKEAMEDILITEWLEKEDANFLVVKNIINLIEEKF